MLIGTFGPGQPSGWSMKRYLNSSRRRPPRLRFGEVPDLVALGRPLAGEQVELVIAIEMHLVVGATESLAGSQFVDNVGVAGRCNGVGNESSPEKMPFSTLPGGTFPGQRMRDGTRNPPS